MVIIDQRTTSSISHTSNAISLIAASTTNDGHQEDAAPPPGGGDKDTVPTTTTEDTCKNDSGLLLSGEYEATATKTVDKYAGSRSTPNNRQSSLDALTFYSSPSGDESSFPQKSDSSIVNRTRRNKEDIDHELGQRSHSKSIQQEDDGANNSDTSKRKVLAEHIVNNEIGGTSDDGINKPSKHSNDTTGIGEPKTITANNDSGSRKTGKESITTRNKPWTQDKSPYFNKTVKVVKGKYAG